MADKHFLAGVGTALLLKGNELIGVANTLTESTFSFDITGEDVRGGRGNALLGRYFHDSSLEISLVDALFNLNYMALALGVNVNMGGLSVMEEELAVVAGGGSVTLTETAVAFNGTMIGWYKRPDEDDWTIGTIAGGTTMAIPSSAANDHYCVKYFWQNPNAKSITINAQYVPAELHVVIINDLYSGDIADIGSATRYGRLITDIPRLQMAGSQELNLTATSAATVSLTGNALATNMSNGCEDDLVYGTMTEEVFGSVWQDDVRYLAVANSDVSVVTEGTATLEVWAVYDSGIASSRIDNSACTFVVEASPASTATGTTVGENTGIITAGATAGNAVIGVTLTGYDKVPEAYANVTVTDA